MLFNSFEFAAFLLAALCTYYAVASWKLRKVVLVAASYTFYGAYYPPYVLLLFATSCFDYAVGRRLARASTGHRSRVLLVASCSSNLLVLATFKYGDFLVSQLNAVLAGFSLPAIPSYAGGLTVPLGLSFYTFQSIGYVVDIYRGEIKPVRSFSDYLLFVSFFPQLIAGPILRAVSFLPQLRFPRRPAAADVAYAGRTILLGLFQKVVIADNIAPLVNVVYQTPAAFSGADKWIAVYGFAFQIWCDFAGYSNIAIGVAALFCFRIPENFNNPYVSASFREFWSRWHISLSRWLRDYLYIPLGGNRVGRSREYVNLMLTMLLGGLWHGASWTFVAWGGLHGSYLVVERLMARSRFPSGALASFPIMLLRMIVVFHLVCLGWVFFRASSFSTAAEMLAGMSQPFPLAIAPAIADRALYVAAAGAFLVGTWLVAAAGGKIRLEGPVRTLCDGLMLVALILMPGQPNAFIYFQF